MLMRPSGGCGRGACVVMPQDSQEKADVRNVGAMKKRNAGIMSCTPRFRRRSRTALHVIDEARSFAHLPAARIMEEHAGGHWGEAAQARVEEPAA